jgi:uncharacterized protein YtpQ (UPF0354 family)
MLKKLLNSIVPPITPEQFTFEAVAFLQSLGQNLTAEIVEPLSLKVTRANGESSDLHLTNAYSTYLNNRSQRKSVIAQFVLSIVEADVDGLLPKNVIPTIKDKAYVEEVRAQVAAKGKSPEEFFVTEEYNQELVIVYAVDSPTSIRYLNPSDLPELNLNGESLRSFAVGNLQQIVPSVEVHGNPPFFQLKAGGMFESALLLFDRVWDKKELQIEGDIIVAVPSRETLLVADGSSEKAVVQIQKAASEMHRRQPTG